MTSKIYHFQLRDIEISEIESYLASLEGTSNNEKLRAIMLNLVRPQDEHDLSKTKHCPFYCFTSTKNPTMIICALGWIKKQRLVDVPRTFCLDTCQILMKDAEELEKVAPIPEKPSVYNVQPILVKHEKGQTEQTIDYSKSHMCKLRARMFYSYKELPCIRREVTCPEIECIKRVSDKFL